MLDQRYWMVMYHWLLALDQNWFRGRISGCNGAVLGSNQSIHDTQVGRTNFESGLNPDGRRLLQFIAGHAITGSFDTLQG